MHGQSPPSDVDLGSHYARIRLRFGAFVREVAGTDARTPVPACPGWTVHDVVAHLVGIIEDAAAGKISGIPSAAQTEEQVRRHRHDDLIGLVDQWDLMGPFFEPVLTQRAIWPAVMDAWTHEQDVRGALGRPGGRDDPFAQMAAGRLLADLQEGGPVPGAIGLMPFDLVRTRLGRRTREQAAALAWGLDGSALEALLDRLFVFGPAVEPIVE